MSTSGKSNAAAIVYHIFMVITRVVTNFFAPAVWLGVYRSSVAALGWRNIFTPFWQGLSDGITWTFSTPAGLIVASLCGILGLIHAIRMIYGGTHLSGLGFFGFLLDNTWSLPNSLVGSLFATVTLYISINKSHSKGSGRLVLDHGVFGNYATTLGNVTAGTAVPKHEMTHVVQAWIFGPFFYPIFAVNYVVNTLIPYWWIVKKLFNIYPHAPINSFGHYFSRGVYPFTIFEWIAYGIEGSPI